MLFLVFLRFAGRIAQRPSFFFSSRRRHTRFKCDWSSDVCSSDLWVNPLSGGKAETNGLIYGLVQSGKTGVLTVTGAMGADEGYRTLIILTSDIDPLYEQTRGRAQEAFPGMDVLGKNDIRDHESFMQRIKRGTCAIVVTKNSSLLKTLIENFKVGGVRALTCLIIDDE